MGDPAGVGIEVALDATARPDLHEAFDLCLVGSRLAIEKRARLLSLPVAVELVDVGDAPADPGRPTRSGANTAVESIAEAARMCLSGEVDAMVTGPVSKAAVAGAGVEFTGHTEFLAALTGSPTVVMTFVCGARRVGLATTHHALSDVPAMITSELIVSKLRVLSEGLTGWFGVEEPRIAVAALNPHAGEDGRLGDEEARVIGPAVEKAAEAGVLAEGPFAADALFRSLGDRDRGGPRSGFDAVLAMYHDQGTIPAKLWGRETVNVTLGLPIVRTSVDHGTAFEIAGSGEADSTSMAAAVRLAGAIAQRRAARSK